MNSTTISPWRITSFISLAILVLASAARAADSSWHQVGADGFGDPGLAVIERPTLFHGSLYVGSSNWGFPPGGGRLFRWYSSGSWGQVGTDGFGESANGSLVPGVEFAGDLYLGTFNIISGGQIWRSPDGMNWTRVATDGLGDAGNSGVLPLAVFGNRIYVTTSRTAGGGEIWSSADGLLWTQVNADGFGDLGNHAINSALVFAGALYVGTSNSTTGGEVWRSADGVSWAQVNSSGFGDASNTSVMLGTVYRDYLYAGTARTGGGGVWRSADGVNWSQVSTPGFGSASTWYVRPEAVFGSELYAGTWAQTGGAAIWRTQDGTSWTQVIQPGFSDPGNRAVMPFALSDGVLRATTENQTTGGEYWVQSQPPLGSNYCTGAPNSVGPGARLTASGYSSIVENHFRLTVTGCPPDTWGIFFLGSGQISKPFGDGWKCIGGPLRRALPPVLTDSTGGAGLALDLTSWYGGGVFPGAPGVDHQFFYSDSLGGPAGFNLSDAVHVVHTP
jgi:hypothetical protein